MPRMGTFKSLTRISLRDNGTRGIGDDSFEKLCYKGKQRNEIVADKGMGLRKGFLFVLLLRKKNDGITDYSSGDDSTEKES